MKMKILNRNEGINKSFFPTFFLVLVQWYTKIKTHSFFVSFFLLSVNLRLFYGLQWSGGLSPSPFLPHNAQSCCSRAYLRLPTEFHPVWVCFVLVSANFIRSHESNWDRENFQYFFTFYFNEKLGSGMAKVLRTERNQVSREQRKALDWSEVEAQSVVKLKCERNEIW